MSDPSTNGVNGHDDRGRFTCGNSGGPGNPHAARVARLRSLFLNCISDDDLKAIVLAVAKKAKRGDIAAVKILLEHTLGKPTLALDPDRAELSALKIETERLELKDRLSVQSLGSFGFGR